MTSSCPDRQQLVAYVNGALPLETADIITDHLERCPSCEHVIAALEREPGALAAELRGMQNADLVAILDGSPIRARHPSSSSTTMPRITLPGYELLGELGRGGMGVVYKARQVRLNRTVALKMIVGSAHVDAESLARFQREAQA